MDALDEIQARLKARDAESRRVVQPPLADADELLDGHHGLTPGQLRRVADYIERLDAGERLFVHERMRRSIDAAVARGDF